MIDIGLRDVFLSLVVIINAVGVKAMFRLADRLTEIRDHLAVLNGRVGKLEALQEKLEQDNNNYHAQCIDRLTYLERKTS